MSLSHFWHLKTVKYWFLYGIFCCFAAQVAASPVDIVYFYDGDTVKLRDITGEYKLRISDIDAPERNQTYGKKSRRALMQLCQNALAEVQIEGVDKYARYLGKIQCNQQDVGAWMVKNGHAWASRYTVANPELLWLEQTAQTQQIGLWHAKKPMPPWIWRKKHPHR